MHGVSCTLVLCALCSVLCALCSCALVPFPYFLVFFLFFVVNLGRMGIYFNDSQMKCNPVLLRPFKTLACYLRTLVQHEIQRSRGRVSKYDCLTVLTLFTWHIATPCSFTVKDSLATDRYGQHASKVHMLSGRIICDQVHDSFAST